MKKIAFIAILAFAISLMACDEFFSTSWGSPREFQLSNVNVEGDNVDQWFELVVGDPDLALIVSDAIAETVEENAEALEEIADSLEEIAEKLDDPTIGNEEKAKLEEEKAKLEEEQVKLQEEQAKLIEGGIRIAIEASGIGTSMVTHASNLLAELDNSTPSEDMIRGILENIQNDFINGNGYAAADNIARMVEPNITGRNDGDVPQFDPLLAGLVQPGDAAQTIIVLALASAPDDIDYEDPSSLNKIEDLVEGLTLNNAGKVAIDESSGTPSSEALTLAAYFNLITSDERFDNNPLTKAIRGLPLLDFNR